MTPEWDNKNWLQLESQRGAGHELNSSLPLPPSLTHCSNIIIAWIHNLSVSSLVYDVNPHDVRAWWELKGLPYMVVMISEACKALLWRRDNPWLQREREGGGGWRGGVAAAEQPVSLQEESFTLILAAIGGSRDCRAASLQATVKRAMQDYL